MCHNASQRMYVYMYVCVYVCMCICVYAYMYVCMCGERIQDPRSVISNSSDGKSIGNGREYVYVCNTVEENLSNPLSLVEWY